MATEYRLPYTANEINLKLGKIDKNESDIGQLQDTMNDKLDSSKLTEAINYALTQAKESGEFKGDKGDTGEKGETGEKGADGKTPVKGTDYFTEADKQAFVTDVLNALPTWTGGSY